VRSPDVCGVVQLLQGAAGIPVRAASLPCRAPGGRRRGLLRVALALRRRVPRRDAPIARGRAALALSLPLGRRSAGVGAAAAGPQLCLTAWVRTPLCSGLSGRGRAQDSSWTATAHAAVRGCGAAEQVRAHSACAAPGSCIHLGRRRLPRHRPQWRRRARRAARRPARRPAAAGRQGCPSPAAAGPGGPAVIGLGLYTACTRRLLVGGPAHRGACPGSPARCWLQCGRSGRLRKLGGPAARREGLGHRAARVSLRNRARSEPRRRRFRGACLGKHGRQPVRREPQRVPRQREVHAAHGRQLPRHLRRARPRVQDKAGRKAAGHAAQLRRHGPRRAHAVHLGAPGQA
jgi:hypothetical protein